MPRPAPEITRRKKRFGRCRICLRFGKLTKEHVPPEKAFNDRAFLRHYIDEVNRGERLRWEVQEENTNGIYIFTLCEKCNSQTGHRYGRDYVNFVQLFAPIFKIEDANHTVSVDVKDFFPVRVVKQVISMMLSTSNPTTFNNHKVVAGPRYNPSVLKDIPINYPTKAHLLNVYDELRGFVRKRDSKGLPRSVRLYAFASVSRGLAFRTGIMSLISLTTKNVAFLAVTGSHPIHWVLLLDVN
jgi:hypothetical protein